MNDKSATLIAHKALTTRSEKPCLECGITFPPNTNMYMYLYKVDEGQFDRRHLCLDCKKYYATRQPEYNAKASPLKGILL